LTGSAEVEDIPSPAEPVSAPVAEVSVEQPLVQAPAVPRAPAPAPHLAAVSTPPAPAPVTPPALREAPKPHVATVARLPQRPVHMPELPPKPAVEAVPEPQGEARQNRRFYDAKDAAPKHSRASKLFFATGWFLLAGAIVGLTTWPISTQTQFTLGLVVLAAMTVIRKLRLGGIWRPTFLALGITMILRYVYWRTTSTLPPMHDWVNFTPGFMLYLAEMYCVLMFFISMFIIADPIERKPPPDLPDDRLPTVDVYIPSYNEGADLLAATIAAATQMDYPKDKLNVYLLDDGGTDQKCNQSDPEKAAEAIARRAELQSLCLEMGINYITRARNEHAKAGNMNNALQQTSGQIIVVFDADHAPARQFLRETVGYFALDRRLFLVQTPHFFINPDPVEKNLQTFDRMPSENEMFYGTIQKGLDKWNGAFFCGSAALISRRALESVGGFSGISITEDCETALDLHKRGWNSIYVDKPLIAGLQPESLVSFIGQRSRWCRGMVQILVLKNPLLARNISLKQRICYVSSMFYWLFPIPRMIFLLSPFLYIFFSMQIFQANAQEFFAYVSIYMLTHMSIQNYLHGSTRWPWISEAYEYVQTIYLVKGIWGVLLNPRKPTFNVTAKGLTLDNDHLSELAWPYFAFFGLILLSLVVAVSRFLAENEFNELLLIVGGWSFYNLLIAGVALGIVAERRERRKTPRLVIERAGELHVGEHIVPVDIQDCSIGGMRIKPKEGRLPEGYGRGTPAFIHVLPTRPDFDTDAIPCTIQNASNDGKGAVYGLQFRELRPVHFRGIADAMYSDMAVFENFRMSRRKIKGITMGTLQFLWWSMHHTVRAFYYMIALRNVEAPKVQDGEQMAPTEYKGAHPDFHEPATPVDITHPQPEAIIARPVITAH
ncbi:MAG TPA: UDP-forming cellulose synthase catalytic subunit, partial [Beijerinckiaceae bacterium]|nr:UDP-forming cellulose synthase catalytic subunit [Beijerinckiaceae bacterium]